MMSWIKQTLASLTGGQPAESAAAVAPASPKVEELLLKGLEPLKKRAADLPARVAQYIVAGTGAEILLQLRTIGNLSPYASGVPKAADWEARWELYSLWDQVPPEFWIRLGRVLVADSVLLMRMPDSLFITGQTWLEALALDLAGRPVRQGLQSKADAVTPHPLASFARLEALLERAGQSTDELVVAVFNTSPNRVRWALSQNEFLAAIPGFQDSVVRSADRVRHCFRDESFERRGFVLGLVKDFDAAGLHPFAPELVALTLDSSVRVRSAATPLALRAGEPALRAAEQAAITEKPEQRVRALQLLWSFGTEEARSFVLGRREADAAASVKKAIDELVSRADDVEAYQATPLVPSAPDLHLEQPLSEAAQQALLELLAAVNTQIRQQRQRADPRWQGQWSELSTGEIDKLVAQVRSHPGEGPLYLVNVNWLPDGTTTKLLLTWVKRADVTLVQLVRLLIATQLIRHDNRWVGITFPAARVLNQFARAGERGGLLELAEALRLYGIPEAVIGRCWFGYFGGPLGKGWAPGAIWPFFAQYSEYVEEALNPSSPVHKQFHYSKERVFDALETFPTLPPEFVPRLFEMALGAAKADRAGAQRALANHAGKNAVIIEAVSSGKAETRAAAATWLARLKLAEAIPVLEAALAREKQDAAAGALMGALQSFGVPVDQFLNRDRLLKDAVAGLKKGVPPDLQWFPFDALPPLEWADTGERVPVEVAHWWIVQSFRLKSPEPGAVLCQYFAALRVAPREAFALFVLEAWLAEDLKPVPAAGSAIGSKGVLAVVAAGGGSAVVPVAQRYIKQYYGMRAGQGKALIQMLAWVNHPAAAQLVLSIGSRFRTKGFQEEATRQVQLLAERRGWTVDELADRTIPTAGFDANGTTEIDYGTRKFMARLGPDLQVELFTQDGDAVNTLPDARKDEDETLVKEAKKQWSAARKEIKSVVQLQKERLYEALCTARTWKFEDWQLYLNQHPIVRYYAQRLVWLAERGARAPQSFRPLDDGSLTNFADEAVVVDAEAVVRLAHDSNVTKQDAADWLQHFTDYKISPLFQQFGKGVYQLPEGSRDLAEIEDFRGHVLESFALRGRATKLGYTRGSAQDGGWFTRYGKRFPTLGIEACIEFSGNPLPEPNRPVALLSLSFTRKLPQEEGSSALSLAEVPTILLGECWNDMRLIAAEGGGFDASWEKTVEYK